MSLLKEVQTMEYMCVHVLCVFVCACNCLLYYTWALLDLLTSSLGRKCNVLVNALTRSRTKL